MKTDSVTGSSFKPYIPAEKVIPEFTLRAVLVGAIFGLIFSAVTVYLGLKVGLTVSVAIPIAVMAMALFKFLDKMNPGRRVTILELNTVQITGAAGESIAAGVIFTLPAMVFLGFSLKFFNIFVVALAGGFLGTLFLIVLRNYLIEKQHGKLMYPEGVACAEVLIAGEKGGKLAAKVFSGTILGFVYKFLMGIMHFWKEKPYIRFKPYPGSFVNAEISPELLGVGYLIGIRTASIMVGGGLLAWVVLIPLATFFGDLLAINIPTFPEAHTIGELYRSVNIVDFTKQIHTNFIRYIGAGAVVAGGFINLAKAFPTIIRSFKSGLKSVKKSSDGQTAAVSRISKDLSFTWVGIGTIVMFFVIWALLNFYINPGLILANVVSSLLIIIFGFFFATVSARLVGDIGVSSNPTSGMTIATLMGTCLIFLAVGWTGGAYAAVALSIGAVVAITASNAGNVAQSLKTGYLLGGTPYKQEYGYIIGAVSSILVVGATVLLVNSAFTKINPVGITDMKVTGDMVVESRQEVEGTKYRVVNPKNPSIPPNIRYLAKEDSDIIEKQLEYGIGSESLAAPQATLMATVIQGLLDQKLPWNLVLFGIFITIIIELCGVKGLPFAVGLYLPVSISTPIFMGGLLRWIIDSRFRKPPKGEDPEAAPGMLFSSGLIAGGAIGGLLIAILTGMDLDKILNKIGPSFLGRLTDNSLFALVIFGFMVATLFAIARERKKRTKSNI
ncbi:MAG: oligopeptide transporter, OPT family [Candidatus Aminicenantes bacterium]|nr:oligopeptide transporter, OPT family [Candidatus Aminicenantes bacterium]